MTEQQIDRERLTAHLRRLIDAWEGPGNPSVSTADLTQLLDQLTTAEARATRAQAQSEARRLDITYWRKEVQIAQDHTDRLSREATRQRDSDREVIKRWRDRAEYAEARIKAVEDVLDSRTAAGQDTVRADLIRRALEG